MASSRQTQGVVSVQKPQLNWGKEVSMLATFMLEEKPSISSSPAGSMSTFVTVKVGSGIGGARPGSEDVI